MDSDRAFLFFLRVSSIVLRSIMHFLRFSFVFTHDKIKQFNFQRVRVRVECIRFVTTTVLSFF